MRFLEWLQLTGKILHGNTYLRSMMRKSSVSRMRRFTFSYSVLCLGKVNQNPTSNSAWEEKLSRFKDWPQYRTLDTIDGEPTEFEWNIFQGFTHCSSSTKSTSSWPKWAIHHHSKDELSSCRCSMTSYGDLKTMNKNAMLMPHLCLYLQKDSHQDVGHFSDLDQKRSGILLILTDHKENGTESLNRWWSDSEKADTQFSEPRVHCPEERSKSKGGGKLSIHFCADGETIETVFRTIISVNQLSIYGAISNLCDEYRACQARTGRPVLAGQLTDCSSQQVCWWQHLHLLLKFLHKKIHCKSTKNEWKGSHNQIEWSKFALMQDSWQQLKSDSTSWQRTLKSSHSLQNQWHVVSTLCQKMKNHLTRKVGFEGIPKLGPCWKSQPGTCKINVEWKLELNL